jgi:hypothetical protein
VAEGGKNELGERLALMGFNKRGLIAGLFGEHVDAVQDHGFPYAAEADEDHALGVEAVAEAIEGDSGVIEDWGAPGEFGGWGACSGRKGIGAGIHFYKF